MRFSKIRSVAIAAVACAVSSDVRAENCVRTYSLSCCNELVDNVYDHGGMCGETFCPHDVVQDDSFDAPVQAAIGWESLALTLVRSYCKFYPHIGCNEGAGGSLRLR